MASSLTQNRLLAAVPGFLTAIGVVGTFVGLQLALSQLQLQQNAGVEELRNGIGSLINGASIAFMTSIWGVGTSLSFNIFEKFLERWIRKNIHKLQNKIDFLFPRINAEQSLVHIADYSQSADETLKGLAEKIGDKLQEALVETTTNIQTGLENSLNQIMAPAIQSLVDNANQGSEQALEGLLTQFMGGVGEAGNSQQLMMEKASENMGHAVNDMGTQMQSFIKQLEQKQNNSKQAAETQLQTSTKQFEQLNQLLESFELIASENSKASQSILQSSQQMNGVSNQLGILSSNVKEAADVISEPVIKLMEANQQISMENKAVFEQSENLITNLNHVNDQFSTVSKTLLQATEHANSGFTALDQHLESFKAGLKSHINGLEEELSNLLKGYSEQVQNQTHTRLDEWNKQTREYTTTMKDVVGSMASVIDEIETKSERKYA